jgi:hypothetical protein
MAQRTVVHLIDDLDGGVADETLEFGLEGSIYEIDLSSEHANELRDCLVQYVLVARRKTTRSAPPIAQRHGAATPPSRNTARAARAWALQQGIDVNERGRVPYGIIDQYLAATSN